MLSMLDNTIKNSCQPWQT